MGIDMAPDIYGSYYVEGSGRILPSPSPSSTPQVPPKWWLIFLGLQHDPWVIPGLERVHREV